MPFRQLPNTDANRLNALYRAKAQADGLPDGSVSAFSEATRSHLETLYPQFKQECDERGLALREQTAASAALSAQVDTVRKLVSHFFQVLNLAIDRGEIPATDRHYFELSTDQTTLPDLSRIDDVLLWSGRVTGGETARTQAGAPPLSWPSAAQVGAARSELESLRQAQATASSAYDSEQEDVENLRAEVDALIRDIWDEVEFTYRREDPPSLRRKARLYGVYYATRPGETPEATEEAPIAQE